MAWIKGLDGAFNTFQALLWHDFAFSCARSTFQSEMWPSGEVQRNAAQVENVASRGEVWQNVAHVVKCCTNSKAAKRDPQHVQ